MVSVSSLLLPLVLREARRGTAGLRIEGEAERKQVRKQRTV